MRAALCRHRPIFVRLSAVHLRFILYLCGQNLDINRYMVKHIILWTLRDDLNAAEKQAVKQRIKAGLEGLVGVVPGLLEAKVHIDGRLASSNADLMLDTTLESPAALQGYAQHPEHLRVANEQVRPYTAQRTCLDYAL